MVKVVKGKQSEATWSGRVIQSIYIKVYLPPKHWWYTYRILMYLTSCGQRSRNTLSETPTHSKKKVLVPVKKCEIWCALDACSMFIPVYLFDIHLCHLGHDNTTQVWQVAGRAGGTLQGPYLIYDGFSGQARQPLARSKGWLKSGKNVEMINN